jgi:hypothetical protein
LCYSLGDLFSERKEGVVHILFLGLAILLFHDPLHSAFGVPYMQDKLKVINYYFTNIVIFITFAILIGSLAFLKWISEKNEDQNVELINDLNKANEVLIERNTEIESQSARSSPKAMCFRVTRSNCWKPTA